MKFSLVVLSVFAAGSVYSQTSTSNDGMDAQINRWMLEQPRNQSLFITQAEKPNEIKRDTVSYSGIAVQLLKTDNLIELINPAAPPEYGTTEDNTARDPIDGHVSGLKLFSIRF